MGQCVTIAVGNNGSSGAVVPEGGNGTSVNIGKGGEDEDEEEEDEEEEDCISGCLAKIGCNLCL